MKRIAKWPLFFIAIPWALIMLLVQTVYCRNGMARGGVPAISGVNLGGGGMGGMRDPVPGGTTPLISGLSLGAADIISPYNTLRTTITDLTPDQSSKLSEATTAWNTKLSDWQNSSQTALTALTGDAYNTELYKQNLLREDILNDAHLAMSAILTPTQAEKWETALLNNQLHTSLGKLGLTDAQKTKTTQLVAATAQKLAAAKDKDALVKVRAELWKTITGLLTDIQVTQLFAPTFLPRGTGRGTRGTSTVTPGIPATPN